MLKKKIQPAGYTPADRHLIYLEVANLLSVVLNSPSLFALGRDLVLGGLQGTYDTLPPRLVIFGHQDPLCFKWGSIGSLFSPTIGK